MSSGGEGSFHRLGGRFFAQTVQGKAGDADPLGDFFAGGEQQKATRCQQQCQEKQKGEKGTFAL